MYLKILNLTSIAGGYFSLKLQEKVGVFHAPLFSEETPSRFVTPSTVRIQSQERGLCNLAPEYSSIAVNKFIQFHRQS